MFSIPLPSSSEFDALQATFPQIIHVTSFHHPRAAIPSVIASISPPTFTTALDPIELCSFLGALDVAKERGWRALHVSSALHRAWIFGQQEALLTSKLRVQPSLWNISFEGQLPIQNRKLDDGCPESQDERCRKGNFENKSCSLTGRVIGVSGLISRKW